MAKEKEKPSGSIATGIPPCNSETIDSLTVLMSTRVELFNARRSHEWLVIIYSIAFLFAVDSVVSTIAVTSSLIKIWLDAFWGFTWWYAGLTIVALSTIFYEIYVQRENKKDRNQLDLIYDIIVNCIKDENNTSENWDKLSLMRDKPDDQDGKIRKWAFVRQMAVLGVTVVSSGFLPYILFYDKYKDYYWCGLAWGIIVGIIAFSFIQCGINKEKR